ncbi:MAG: HEAT repeat domain-containing protein [Thermoguttaceae bacterium]
MASFVEKTVKFIGKSENPAAVEILLPLLNNDDSFRRSAAFDALFLRNDPAVHILLFQHFVKNQEMWANSTSITSERISKLTDAALKSDKPAFRDAAFQLIPKYKLYETLPTILTFVEGSNTELVAKGKEVLMLLTEAFYNDLVSAPNETERRNLDRRREWFVQILDGPIKRFASNHIDELIESLLILAKKDYQTLKMIFNDHRSAACKKASELLQFGEHGSYFRLLLSYVGDSGAPAVVDEIICARSDINFVQKLFDVVGTTPSSEFKAALKRFKHFDWFNANNPELPQMIECRESEAVQLLQSSSIPKEKALSLYRFFLEQPSPIARRSAAEALKRVVGDESNSLLLEFLTNSDAQTVAIIFRILKSRGVKEMDQDFLQLVERPDPEIRQAIYDTMPDLHIESFASRVNQFTPNVAKTLGRYVCLVDPNTRKVLSDDIMSPIPIRRQSACIVAAATGLANEYEERLINLAMQDDESNVRSAAVAALSTILTKETFDTIQMLTNDRSLDMRNAAAEALQEWMNLYNIRTQQQ